MPHSTPSYLLKNELVLVLAASTTIYHCQTSRRKQLLYLSRPFLPSSSIFLPFFSVFLTLSYLWIKASFDPTCRLLLDKSPWVAQVAVASCQPGSHQEVARHHQVALASCRVALVSCPAPLCCPAVETAPGDCPGGVTNPQCGQEGIPEVPPGARDFLERCQGWEWVCPGCRVLLVMPA